MHPSRPEFFGIPCISGVWFVKTVWLDVYYSVSLDVNAEVSRNLLPDPLKSLYELEWRFRSIILSTQAVDMQVWFESIQPL